MSILSDKWIKEQSINNRLIAPFVDCSMGVKEDNVTPVTSYGLSSYGYDIRLGNSFKLFTQSVDRTPIFYIRKHYEELNVVHIDPMNFDDKLVSSVVLDDDEYLTIPGGGFALGVSLERIKLPRDISAICMEKSTLARCGLSVTITPLEAGWEGYVTLEISNKTNLPIKLTPGMGISQVLFFKGNEPCEISYSDRNGKYQNQPAQPVLPRRKL